MLRVELALFIGLLILLIASTSSVSTPATAKSELAKLGLYPLEVKDVKGKILDYATVGQAVAITSNVSAMNSRYVGVPFTIITEIRDQNDITVYLEAVESVASTLYTEGHTTTNFSWQPDELGEYRIAIIVLSNLTNPEVLTWQRTIELSVLGECNLPACIVLGDDDSYRQQYRSTGTVREGPAKQQSFTGLFTYEPDDKCKTAKVVRCTPYKLDGKSVYSGADNLDDHVGYYRIRDLALANFESVNLDEFVGHRVEIIGKVYKYTFEGPVIEEIIPIRIRIID